MIIVNNCKNFEDYTKTIILNNQSNNNSKYNLANIVTVDDNDLDSDNITISLNNSKYNAVNLIGMKNNIFLINLKISSALNFSRLITMINYCTISFDRIIFCTDNICVIQYLLSLYPGIKKALIVNYDQTKKYDYLASIDKNLVNYLIFDNRILLTDPDIIKSVQNNFKIGISLIDSGFGINSTELPALLVDNYPIDIIITNNIDNTIRVYQNLV